MAQRRKSKFNKLKPGDIVRVLHSTRGAAESGSVGRVHKCQKTMVGLRIFVHFGMNYADGKPMLMTFSPHQLEPASSLDRLAWDL